MDSSLIATLIERFDGPDVDALVLMGSYARQTANLYSDIDLIRFTSAHGLYRTRIFQGLIAEQLVVVNDLGSAAVEEIFTQPQVASSDVMGLRLGPSWLLRRFSESDQRYSVLMRFSATLHDPFHATCVRAMKTGQAHPSKVS
jgi:predicted nucleotidyltransferase